VSDFVGWGIFVVAVGSATVGATRRFLERRRARRELVTKPVLGPASPDGAVVRVTGIVRAIEPLSAPLSGRECVVFRARVDTTNWIVRRGGGHGVHEWLELTPFLLDRGEQGTVRVEGSHALLDLPATVLRVPDRLRRDQFLARMGARTKHGARARYEETLVEPGMRVSIAGLVMMDPAEEPSTRELHFRDAPPPSLRLTGNLEHPLAIGTVSQAS
jgi:hypothetical protein